MALVELPTMSGHEHYARYDFPRDALYCPGCGRVLITAEALELQLYLRGRRLG